MGANDTREESHTQRRNPHRSVVAPSRHRPENGEELAPERGMSDKRLDERPGAVPDIRAEGDSVIYLIGIPGERAQLILRCSPTGALYAALTADVSRT
jgi:hypothetical protein